MMKPMLPTTAALLAALLGMAALATPTNTNPGNTSGQSKADCAKISQITDCRQQIALDPKEVQQCIMRGFDAPITCRRDEGKSAGVRVGGSSGFSYSTVQSPESPPGAMGGRASVGVGTVQRSFGYPPWQGFPCKLPGGIDLCASGATPYPTIDPNDPCPVQSDTGGLYGEKKPLADGMALSAPCGAALPLTLYELTLNKNTNRVASTEYGDYHIHVFEQVGSTYKKVSGSPFRLPEYLCEGVQRHPNGKPIIIKDLTDRPKERAKNRSVDLTPPIAQTITFNSNTQSIALRLRSRATPASTNPKDYGEWQKMKPKYKEGEEEKFLILPIENGQLKVPDTCEEGAFFFAPRPHPGDLVIEAEQGDICEGTPEQCDMAKTEPDEPCDVQALPVTNPSGAAACKARTQYFVLDRPNLLYPAGTNVTTMGLEGRSAVLAPTVADSKVFVPEETILRLGISAPPITLKEGGVMLLQAKKKDDDPDELVMKGPVTIDAASGRITMTAGGQRKDASGNILQQISAGTSYAPPKPIVPWLVYPKRSIEMPAGYLIPTQSYPYAQMPVGK